MHHFPTLVVFYGQSQSWNRAHAIIFVYKYHVLSYNPVKSVLDTLVYIYLI